MGCGLCPHSGPRKRQWHTQLTDEDAEACSFSLLSVSEPKVCLSPVVIKTFFLTLVMLIFRYVLFCGKYTWNMYSWSLYVLLRVGLNTLREKANGGGMEYDTILC